MRRLCEWLAKRLPKRVLHIHKEPYLWRFYVCGDPGALSLWPGEIKPVLPWLPFTVYLHGFLQPDASRDLHNHPWAKSVSLILHGGYEEERWVDGRIVERVLRPGRVNRINRDTFHRVDHLHANPTWTLFVTGKYVGVWGFKDRETGEFIPWRRYPDLGSFD
jgi:hypothetical protein